jgi:hypothetical protein
VVGSSVSKRRSCLALGISPALEISQAPLELADAPASQAPVGLELRLARASRADAATEPLEVLPQSAHAGKVVFELRELHLELSLCRHCVLREDVEDELCAVDDAQLELVLQAPLLSGVEVVVDDERLGIGARHGFLQLDELALTDIGARIGRGAALNELADRVDTGRPQELSHLPQLLVLVDSLGQHRDEKAALGLSPGRGVRLVWRHGLIMPSLRREVTTRFGGRPPRAGRREP